MLGELVEALLVIDLCVDANSCMTPQRRSIGVKKMRGILLGKNMQIFPPGVRAVEPWAEVLADDSGPLVPKRTWNGRHGLVVLRSQPLPASVGCLGIDLSASTKVNLEGLQGQARPDCDRLRLMFALQPLLSLGKPAMAGRPLVFG